MEKAKIGMIQFQLSPPKPDMDNQIVVNDYRQMDRILKEERAYLLNMCKKIKKAGCNVIFIQKSILRDAVNELSLHFLSKLKIMVVKDIERDEVEFICKVRLICGGIVSYSVYSHIILNPHHHHFNDQKTTGCKPIADIDSFTEDKLGYAELVEESESQGGAKVVRATGVKVPGQTVSVLIHGANHLVLEEAERSLHDALCVIRCLVKKKALIAGGGAPEIEVSQRLMAYAKTLKGMAAYCFQAYAEALEVIPSTLAENAGLNPVKIVTELRNRHAKGEKTAGINVRKGIISNILEENVIQPLLVSTSALELATETVRMMVKWKEAVDGRCNYWFFIYIPFPPFYYFSWRLTILSWLVNLWSSLKVLSKDFSGTIKLYNCICEYKKFSYVVWWEELLWSLLTFLWSCPSNLKKLLSSKSDWDKGWVVSG